MGSPTDPKRRRELRSFLFGHESPKRIRLLIAVGEVYNIKCIVTTDSHYLKKEHKLLHYNFLNSKENESRETGDFYNSTYMMEKEELFSWYIQKYDNKEVMLYIKKLNFPQEFMMVLDKKRPKFQNTDLNKRILADYKRRGWITRIDPEDDMLRVNGRKILPL